TSGGGGGGGASAFFTGEVLEQVLAAAQLCWLTVRCCGRNAEELARSGGAGVMVQLLSSCMQALRPGSPAALPPARIATAALRCLAGLAAVPEARAALAAGAASDTAGGGGGGGGGAADAAAPAPAATPTPTARRLIRDVLWCTAHLLTTHAASAAATAAATSGPATATATAATATLSQCHGAVDAALIVLGQLAASPELQREALAAGAMQALLPLVLSYDNTLPDAVQSALLVPYSGPEPSSPLSQGLIALLALPDTAVPPTSTASSNPASTSTTPNSGSSTGNSSSNSSSSSDSTPNHHHPARSSTPAAMSQHAVAAAQVLARLAGMLPAPHHTPTCAPARAALAALLTEPLAGRLGTSGGGNGSGGGGGVGGGGDSTAAAVDPRPLLRLLCGTHETCRVIWNPGMRRELLTFLAAAASSSSFPFSATSTPSGFSMSGRGHAQQKTNGSREEEGSNAGRQPGSADGEQEQRPSALSSLQRFSHGQLSGELVVGGVYVRVFIARPNELPPDPAGFCKALVRYLFDALLPLPPGSLPPVSASASASTSSSLPALLSALTATRLLLLSEPRLLGLLASRSALSPFVGALQPAAAAPAAAGVKKEAVGRAAGATAAGVTAADASASRGGQQQHLQQEEGKKAKEQDLLGEELSGGAEAGAVPSIAETKEKAVAAAAAAAAAEAEERRVWSDRLALGGLGVLALAAQHGGCLEAFAEESCLRLLFWLLHAPTSPHLLTATLRLLRTLTGQTAAAAAVAAQQGGWVFLLEVLLPRENHLWMWQQQQAQAIVAQRSGVTHGSLLLPPAPGSSSRTEGSSSSSSGNNAEGSSSSNKGVGEGA
ncbi:hypothetical protein Agub_g8025, partial [Astrephomene gubernaculifera]